MAAISTEPSTYRLDADRYARIVESGALDGQRVELIDGIILQVAADSVPEPDLAIVHEPESPQHHPRTAVLVVEVAHSSHALDRGRKAELYAAAGIRTYWLIDIPARAVEVRTDPGATGYRTLRTLEPGDLLRSPCEGVADLAVDELLEGI